jgi:5,10-methylenetetrahydromethanopterin reductase
MLTYDFRLPPGPRTVEYALLAEELGFRAVWCPEIPAFGHDIWVTLARIAEKTKRIKFGPSVLIPSYRHPMAQASAIATLEQIAPGRLMVGFGTGFTGRAGMGKKPLSLASMRTHITQVRTLLRGDVADIDGGLAQFLASDGWLPDRPIDVPIYMAGQGPKARALAKEITDGLISLGGPAEGFETCLVSTGGTVLGDDEDVTSPRASTALKPLIALAYHHRYTTEPESLKALPNGDAWLASVDRVDENLRHLSVHRGHNLVRRRIRRQTDDLHRHSRGVARTSLPARGPRRHWHHLRDQWLRCGAGAEGLRGGCCIEVTVARRLFVIEDQYAPNRHLSYWPSRGSSGSAGTPVTDLRSVTIALRRGRRPRVTAFDLFAEAEGAKADRTRCRVSLGTQKRANKRTCFTGMGLLRKFYPCRKRRSASRLSCSACLVTRAFVTR